jgi:hypothetical protein
MVMGAYDLQKLRIQAGLRLCANFRARLGAIPADEDESEAAEAERESAIKLIKADYARLTDAIISPKGRINMAKLDFSGAALISSAAEYSLVDSYVARFTCTKQRHFCRCSMSIGRSRDAGRRVHRSGIAVSSIAVGDSLMLNLERKLIPSKPSTRLPNGLLSSRCTAVTTPNASAFPTLTDLAYPISANAFPPTVFMIT